VQFARSVRPTITHINPLSYSASDRPRIMAGMPRSLAVAVLGIALALVIALATHARADGGGCPQWEVMLAQPPAIATMAPSGIGKPVVEKAPAGWEPFAYAPSGQLVYRRCAR
jgi:hypothetical protein